MHPFSPFIADLIAASRRQEMLADAEARRMASLGKRHPMALGRPSFLGKSRGTR